MRRQIYELSTISTSSMPTRYEDTIRNLPLLGKEELLRIRDFIDGLLGINLGYATWRDNLDKKFIKRCLETSIKKFDVKDQIQMSNGILYLVQGETGEKNHERYYIFWDGVLSTRIAERQPDSMLVFEEKVGEGKTIIVCTPIPKGIHYFRIGNTTGYYRMVNGKMMLLDNIDYKLAGFEP